MSNQDSFKKKYFLLFIFLLFLGVSCSQVNRDSQTYYLKDHPLRHGIVPIPKTSKTEKLALRVVNPKSVQRGQVIYKENCFSCHGAEGRGDGPSVEELNITPKDLVKIARQVPNFNFYMMISQWTGDMPGWANVLSANEITDVESYIIYLAQQKTR